MGDIVKTVKGVDNWKLTMQEQFSENYMDVRYAENAGF